MRPWPWSGLRRRHFSSTEGDRNTKFITRTEPDPARRSLLHRRRQTQSPLSSGNEFFAASAAGERVDLAIGSCGANESRNAGDAGVAPTADSRPVLP